MRNYFNYFTEIEERFQRRRGTFTILSTLDWSLIEAWREAGVPLEAVLRGIDDAFDKHDARVAKNGTGRIRRVNGLAWAAQSVMLVTEQMREAAVGATTAPGKSEQESGFEAAPVSAYLSANADTLEEAKILPPAEEQVRQIAARLRELAVKVSSQTPPTNEDLEQNLTVLEEKLFGAVMLVTPEKDLVGWREQAARGLTGNRMNAMQIKQVTQQFLNKRMLEAHNLPRLSLFYMEHR